MRFLITIFIFTAFSVGVNAQVDSRKKSGATIPAVESPKDSTDGKKILPIQPKDFDAVSVPKVVGKLEFPKKEFSMFPQEEFGNPGELYAKRLKKLDEEVKPEGHGEFSGLKEDAFWGDYKTKSQYIQVHYRDYGEEDGDLLGILVDGDFFKSKVYLTRGFKGFKLNLSEGFNKIEFLALNEGSLLPNTAEYIILDDQNKVITGKVWALSTGVKVTVIIVKE